MLSFLSDVIKWQSIVQLLGVIPWLLYCELMCVCVNEKNPLLQKESNLFNYFDERSVDRSPFPIFTSFASACLLP